MFGPATDDNSADGKVWIFDIISQQLTDISFPSDADQVSLPCTIKNEHDQSIFIIGGKKQSSGGASTQILQFDYTTNTFLDSNISSMPKALYASTSYGK